MTTKEFLRFFLPPMYYIMRDRILGNTLSAKNIEESTSYEEIEKRYTLTLVNRYKLSLQNVCELSKDIPLDWIWTLYSESMESTFYGNFQTLMSYCDLNFIKTPPQNFAIQHGYVFELSNWEKNKLEKINLVWSREIKRMYSEHTQNSCIYPIGAPFFYAESILNENEIASEKNRLGKNLLAFPMHSSHFVDTNYDPSHFIGVLKEQKKSFDTVRVCLYWKDVIRGCDRIFQENGFECVCCGHIFDVNFLRRQKALFEIADATISNGVGSHIGYSLFMNKPHWLVPDSFEYVDLKGTDGEELYSIISKKNYLDVYNAFIDNSNYIITNEQLNVVDKFWGISNKKSPEELKNLIIKLYSN